MSKLSHLCRLPLFAGFIAANLLFCSCGPDVPKTVVELHGTLTRDEIVAKQEAGELIGISEQELVDLCGRSLNTDKYVEYDYKIVIGTCSPYAPAYEWLLVDLDNGVVVDTVIDCD